MINRILYLGDIHSDFDIIIKYIKSNNLKDCFIIQVGDFGVGFKPFDDEIKSLSIVNSYLNKNNIILYAIRGNHDFKTYFDNDPFNLSNIKLIPDYTVLNLCGKNILCIGGALSVDRKILMSDDQKKGDNLLKPGLKWWIDEPFLLDLNKLSSLRNIEIVVTHTSPDYCAIDNTFGFGEFVDGFIKNDSNLKSDLINERKQMSELFLILKLNGNNITNHYYGHFHKSDSINMYGVNHRLLNIGEFHETIINEK